MKALDYTILLLVIIGAVNWGLIGFFRFDLVRMIFGNMTAFSRIIYALAYMHSAISAESEKTHNADMCRHIIQVIF